MLGPNGAGKTTIIKMLTTLTKPDGGRCSIDEIDVVADPLGGQETDRRRASGE